MSNTTQTRYPWRASIRTGVQTALGVLAVLVAAAPIINDFVAEFWPDSPVIAWVAGGAALAGGVATLITRIMAIDAVNDLLTRVGAGASPKGDA